MLERPVTSAAPEAEVCNVGTISLEPGLILPLPAAERGLLPFAERRLPPGPAVYTLPLLIVIPDA